MSIDKIIVATTISTIFMVAVLITGSHAWKRGIQDGRHEMELEAVAAGHATFVSNGPSVEVFSWSDVHEDDISFPIYELPDEPVKQLEFTNNRYEFLPIQKWDNEEISNAIEMLFPSSNKCNLVYCDRHVGKPVLTSTIELR